MQQTDTVVCRPVDIDRQAGPAVSWHLGYGALTGGMRSTHLNVLALLQCQSTVVVGDTCGHDVRHQHLVREAGGGVAHVVHQLLPGCCHHLIKQARGFVSVTLLACSTLGATRGDDTAHLRYTTDLFPVCNP